MYEIQIFVLSLIYQKQNKMTNRINELKQIMIQEENNNFQNGELYNECNDKIYCLEKYGQENYPSEIYDEQGYLIGLKLDNGNEIHYEGMTFENSY